MIRKLIVLAILIGCGFFSSAANAATVSKMTVKEYIVKHSIEMGVDPALALSIAKQESDFRHELKSSYGAVGVFQLLPSTAKRMGYNAYYLSDNIKGGLKYYQMMYKKFGSVELALAAYNAGPGNVARYRGMPPFRETRYFVNSIMSEYKYQKANPDPAILKYRAAKKPAVQNNVLKPKDIETRIKEAEVAAPVAETDTNVTPKNVSDMLTMEKQFVE